MEILEKRADELRDAPRKMPKSVAAVAVKGLSAGEQKKTPKAGKTNECRSTGAEGQARSDKDGQSREN
jgi:hypothetical protein